MKWTGSVVVAVLLSAALGFGLVYALDTDGRPTCGTEAWARKTLTDKDAERVDLWNVTVRSVAALRALRAPSGSFDGRGRDEAELHVFALTADVLAYKLEADSDFHVVIAEPSDHSLTMIAEFPNPGCTSGSRVEREILAADTEFLGLVKERPAARMRKLEKPIQVVITGVLFFDKIHGQAGVAPNGVELHPVLHVERADSFLDGGSK